MEGESTREAPRPRSARRRLIRWAVVAIVLSSFALLLRKFNFARVWAVLREARFDFFLAAAALNVTVNTVARVQRWRSLLRPLPHDGVGPGFGELAALHFASTAANNLVPARPGEALRTMRLHSRWGYSVGALVASQAFEKVIETASLGLLALPMILGFESIPVATIPLVVLALASVGALALVLIAARKPRPANDAPPPAADPVASTYNRLKSAAVAFLRRVLDAAHLMRAPRVWTTALGWSWLSDLADVSMVGLCLAAVHIHVPASVWFLVFVAINFAIVIPSTPGQVGVFEASAVLVLSALGVEHNAAMSFAVLYHAAHLLPTTLLGVIFLAHGAFLQRRGSPKPT